MDVVVQGVEKRFGLVVALDGLHLHLQAGIHLLLAGANGAGKTTLLRLIAGLASPSRGTISVDGVDPRKHHNVRRHIGLLSHQPLLYRELTARENLQFFAHLYDLPVGAVEAALQRARLGRHADRPVHGFSQGMKQRLALARATLHRPKLLLLDEPFTGLDRESSQSLTDQLVERLAEEDASSVLVTHRGSEAARLVNRVAVLRRGRVAGEHEWTPSAVEGPLMQLCQRLGAEAAS
ncbi:MAG: heme ABC exporter ATP-binding protein CcmA [Candidatus Latescibacterota bacterium]|nr:heme ABC exporter ATP-binding protein CcmA [Candidatus Latescibacterota bacterium]